MFAPLRSRCPECAGALLDLGDELVCGSCGTVSGKEVLEAPTRPVTAADFTSQALGGYLGPLEHGSRERSTRGLSSTHSTFGYLKLISDFAGREETASYACVKLIERVCEKLALPRVVAGQAMMIARDLYRPNGAGTQTNSAAVSAHAIIAACKLARVTTVGVKEVVAVHRLLGRRVKFASLVKLSLASPYRTEARRAEDYIGRVVARLSSSEEFTTYLRERGYLPSMYLAHIRGASLAALGAVDGPRRGGHSPVAMAATAVYAGEAVLANIEGRSMLLTQKALANLAGVAEYTVREQYGRLFRPLINLAIKRARQTLQQ